MAKFLRTLAALDEIENIIRNAKTRLNLISPYVDIPEPLLQSLKDAGSNSVNITLVVRKRELHPDVRSQLQRIDHLSLRSVDKLHAKCFFNEQRMVITSMNLYDVSRNNWEMSLLIDASADAQIFTDAVKEAKAIINLSEQLVLTADDGKDMVAAPQNGYCIGCRTITPRDLERPFCLDCYWKWRRQDNHYQKQRYCHTCSQPYPTSKAMPQCDSCYR